MKIRYTKHKLHCEIAILPKLLDYLTGTYIRCRLVNRNPKENRSCPELRGKILLVTLREVSLKNKPIRAFPLRMLKEIYAKF